MLLGLIKVLPTVGEEEFRNLLVLAGPSLTNHVCPATDNGDKINSS